MSFIKSSLESLSDYINENELFKVESEVKEKLDNLLEHTEGDYDETIEVLIDNLSKILEYLESQDKANKKGVL